MGSGFLRNKNLTVFNSEIFCKKNGGKAVLILQLEELDLSPEDLCVLKRKKDELADFLEIYINRKTTP